MKSTGNNRAIQTDDMQSRVGGHIDNVRKRTAKKTDVPTFINVDRELELRCPNPRCGGGRHPQPKLLGFGAVAIGRGLEIKCPRCGTLARFQRI